MSVSRIRLAQTSPRMANGSPRDEALAQLELTGVLDRMIQNLSAQHGVTPEQAREAITVSASRATSRALEAMTATR